MKTLKLFALLLLFSSCASSYKSIEPTTFTFPGRAVNDGVEMKYELGILRSRGNKKFAKDEAKSGLKVMAVELTNHTDSTLTFGKNLRLFSEDQEIYLESPLSVASKINQCSLCYLPYALLTFLTLNVSKPNGEVKIYPIGYGIGPVVTAYNIGSASAANRQLKKALLRNDLFNKEIKPGETATGIVTVRSHSVYNIRPKVVNEKIPTSTSTLRQDK